MTKFLNNRLLTIIILSSTLSSCAMFKQYVEPTGSDTATLIVTPDLPNLTFKIELNQNGEQENYNLGYVHLVEYYDSPKSASGAVMPNKIIKKISTNPNNTYKILASYEYSDTNHFANQRTTWKYSGTAQLKNLKPGTTYLALIKQPNLKENPYIVISEASREDIEKYTNRVMFRQYSIK